MTRYEVWNQKLKRLAKRAEKARHKGNLEKAKELEYRAQVVAHPIVQSRHDRTQAIIEAECQLRAVEAQPGSEELAAAIRERIRRLRERNEHGVISRRNYSKTRESHNPPTFLWHGA